MSNTNRLETTPAETAAINKMLCRAQAGDQSVLPELRKFLDSRPDFCDHVGDLSLHLLDNLLGAAAKGSLLVRETVARKAKAMEEELAGPSPTPLEGLLARRAVLCWLLVHIAELDAADLAAKGVAEGIHVQRRADSANRRFMQTLKTLSTVRRLIPAQKGAKWFAEGATGDAKVDRPMAMRLSEIESQA
jgi:hypothetical protein